MNLRDRLKNGLKTNFEKILPSPLFTSEPIDMNILKISVSIVLYRPAKYFRMALSATNLLKIRTKLLRRFDEHSRDFRDNDGMRRHGKIYFLVELVVSLPRSKDITSKKLSCSQISN